MLETRRSRETVNTNRKMVRIPYSTTLSRFLVATLCVLQVSAAYSSSIPKDQLEPVRVDLTLGRADDAITRLNSTLAANPGDAEAHNLLCRVYYQEERWDDAIHECEGAVRLRQR